MEPLELLLTKEHESLNVSAANIAISLCPYLRHQPYIGAILKEGKRLEAEELRDYLNESALRGVTLSGLANYGDEALNAAVKELEQQSGVKIPQEAVDAYLLQLAGKIVAFGRKQWPIMTENAVSGLPGQATLSWPEIDRLGKLCEAMWYV